METPGWDTAQRAGLETFQATGQSVRLSEKPSLPSSPGGTLTDCLVAGRIQPNYGPGMPGEVCGDLSERGSQKEAARLLLRHSSFSLIVTMVATLIALGADSQFMAFYKSAL